MTNHDMITEGSHKTFRQIWRNANLERLQGLEAKAERKARRAGAPEAYLRITTLTDRLMLEGRGWTFEGREAQAMGLATRFVMKKSLTSE